MAIGLVGISGSMRTIVAVVGLPQGSEGVIRAEGLLISL